MPSVRHTYYILSKYCSVWEGVLNKNGTEEAPVHQGLQELPSPSPYRQKLSEELIRDEIQRIGRFLDAAKILRSLVLQKGLSQFC